MVTMGILAPTDKKGSGATFPHAINNGADSALSVGPLRGNKAIRQSEEEHILGFQPKLGPRSSPLLLSENPQSVRRIGLAVRMRADAVAYDDDLSSQSLPARLGDQTSTG